MDWLAVLKFALSISDWLAKKAHDKQLLDVGEYKAIARNNRKALEKIRLADAARRGSLLDPNDAAND